MPVVSGVKLIILFSEILFIEFRSNGVGAMNKIWYTTEVSMFIASKTSMPNFYTFLNAFT